MGGSPKGAALYNIFREKPDQTGCAKGNIMIRKVSEFLSRSSFKEYLKFIRFDNKSEQSRGLKTKKFALISEVSIFSKNYQNFYKPDAKVTVNDNRKYIKTRRFFLS